MEAGSSGFGIENRSDGGEFSLEDLGFRGGLRPLISAPLRLEEEESGGSTRWVCRKIEFLGCFTLERKSEILEV